MGWNVIDVVDGDSSVGSIVQALALAKSYKDKSTFINIPTTIGHGTSTAGTSKSHHGTYTDEDAAKYATAGVETSHTLSEATRRYWQQAAEQGQEKEYEWNQKLDMNTAAYPESAARLQQRMEGKVNVEAMLGSLEILKSVTATRQFNGWSSTNS
ncbi:transketolase [Paraphoma chrysanthemicola]|nr:transketolase [Paraphoma chrysanthemicola]